MGVDTFHYKWRLQVVIIPLAMLSVPCTLYLIERRANPVTALANLTSNAFFVVFFCYPRICTNCFAVFICRVVQLDPTVSVLEADDRVLCQDSDHAIYQYFSVFFILAVSVGVPLSVAALLHREFHRLPSVGQSLKVRVSDAFGISIDEAGPAVNDVTMGSAYGFLVDAFKPQFYMSESIDMLRKLCLVGLVVLFDRGSVVQLLTTLCISIAFILWHTKAWPYKIDLDNRLRAATELHVCFTIAVALVFHTDLDSPFGPTFGSEAVSAVQIYRDDIETRKFYFDLLLVASFLVCVPGYASHILACLPDRHSRFCG